MKYKSIKKEDALSLFKNIKVLLLTATDLETEVLHTYLKPLSNEFIFKSGIDNYTYYIAEFGNYSVAHVQCRAGSATSSGSLITCGHALAMFSPSIIVMVGIAFGICSDSQNIGDVLLAESLYPYEVARLGKEQIVHRGGTPKSSEKLYNRFMNHKDWSYTYDFEDQQLKSKIINGIVLSGEKLIDNIEERNLLIQRCPEAVGGEMEGTGLNTACEQKKIDWILIKGICDFADGEKGKNKKLNQNIAANAAISYCLSVFSEDHIFSDLMIGQVENVEKQIVAGVDKNLVLFRRYTLQSEPYYLSREIDSFFIEYLTSYNVWFFGTSGSGKSSVIARNLLMKQYDVIQVYLASASDLTLIDILKEILAKLIIHFEIKYTEDINSIDDCINVICNIVTEKFLQNKSVIYVDEIPEYENLQIFKAFCKALHVITLKVKESRPEIEVVFVLSSITSPQENLGEDHKKIIENFKIKEFKKWELTDINDLAKNINSSLNLGFSSDMINQVVNGCDGSPRILKNIFRDYLSTRNLESYTLDRVIKEVV